MPTEDVVVLVELSFTNLFVEAVPWSKIDVSHKPSLVQSLLNLRGGGMKEWEGGGGEREGGREGGKEGGKRNK